MREGTEIAGRYALEALLGHGGMGEVWRGSDRQLRRPVAVKVMQERVTDTRRFEREARIAARLQHPGITVVHDSGMHDGRPFIVMELLNGHDLAAELSEWPGGMPSDRVIPLAIQAAKALQAAHAKKVVHRDLKPANLFLQDDGQLKICDFGIARVAGATDGPASSGYLIGTSSYMSPEQCAGRPVDQRSDLYSLGCVLYALLTGRPPFPSGTPEDIRDQHLHERPSGPRARRPDVPADLDRLVLHLLAKAPDQRPAEAGQVVAALERAHTSQTVPRRARAGPSTRVVDPGGRGDFITLVAAVLEAGPGDRIVVRPGVYEGGIQLHYPLEILGDGEAASIQIRADGAPVLVFAAGDQDARIANLTLRQTGMAADWPAVAVTQGRLELADCDLSSTKSTCVEVTGRASLRLHGSKIHHSRKSGVLIRDGGQATLEDNEIIGNLMAGVTISQDGHATLHRNRINRNTKVGIWVRDADCRVVAEDNDLRGNHGVYGAWNIVRGAAAKVQRARNKE